MDTETETREGSSTTTHTLPPNKKRKQQGQVEVSNSKKATTTTTNNKKIYYNHRCSVVMESVLSLVDTGMIYSVMNHIMLFSLVVSKLVIIITICI